MIFAGRSHSTGWLFVAFLAAGCTSGPTLQPVPPAPTPVSPESQPSVSVTPSGGLWSFNYHLGSVGYRVARNATIVRLDTAGQRESSTSNSHILLTLDSAELGAFTALVDTFATTAQGLVGPAQPIELPAQISGSFTAAGLTLNSQPAGEKCEPVYSALITDLYNLLVVFPAQLSPQLRWTDSVEVQACPAGVPSLSHTTRSYTVAGEVSYQGHPALVVQRVDTLRAQGEGGLQQHPISIDARGTGSATYYLDTASGQILHVTLNHILTLGVTTSARRSQIREDLKQEFEIVR